jgi:RNA-directed DNA polymerase
VRWNKQYQEKHKEYSLYGELLKYESLEASWRKVRKNKGAGGVDKVTIEMFENQLELQLETIQRQLHKKSYQPQPVRRVEILKEDTDKKRKLGIPTIRDRVIQQRLKDILEPIFDLHFSEQSYGYRPGRSAHDAMEEIKTLREQYDWVVDADIKGFFDNVDHDILIDLVNERVSDGSILRLIRLFLEAGVKYDGAIHETSKGTPQGAVISPLLANIYLNHLDRRLEEAGLPFVRYADDFVVFCGTKSEAEEALQLIRVTLHQELKLELSKDKTVIRYLEYELDEKGKLPPEYGPIRFLGFQVRKRWLSPTPKSIKRLKNKIRAHTKRHINYDTKVLLSKLNRIIRGWGNYFRIGTVKTLYHDLDQWTRMRIRLVLGRRKKHIKNNQRWRSKLNSTYTDDILKEMGLITLESLLRG